MAASSTVSRADIAPAAVRAADSAAAGVSATCTTATRPAPESSARTSAPAAPTTQKVRLGRPISAAKACQPAETRASSSSRAGGASATKAASWGATRVLDVSSMRSMVVEPRSGTGWQGYRRAGPRAIAPGRRITCAAMLSRADAVRALAAEPFDIVVVGGGITGAGVAFDAATRGFSVALVEKADFASGTSSRSSKLVHGGLRYLQNFDLGLVREALLERQLLAALAPHLVRPLPLIVPAFGGARPDRMVGLGLNMYDVMSRDRRRRKARDVNLDGQEDWSPDRHRIIGGEEIVERIPALAGRAPGSGYLFYDCQTDDARLVLTVLREAERFGAVFANRAEVTSLAESGGRATGVSVRDLETGEELLVRAGTVVNATGVWADRLRPGELHDEAEVPVIRPSRGTHILIPHDKLPMHDGAIAPAGGGRMIFVLPWLGQTLIGTTDNDYDSDALEHVKPGEEDVAYLLEATNGFFGTELQPSDVAGAFAGVRPLISTGDPKKSVDISRKAELYETSSGMITITGGKLTTWRRMAKMTVDRIVER